MPRDNHVFKKVKNEILTNPKNDGWTSVQLGAAAGIKHNTLRYVCDQLVTEGTLVKKKLEGTAKGQCRVKYFITPKEGNDVYGVGMANKINAHNIFAKPTHCGGRG